MSGLGFKIGLVCQHTANQIVSQPLQILNVTMPNPTVKLVSVGTIMYYVKSPSIRYDSYFVKSKFNYVIKHKIKSRLL